MTSEVDGVEARDGKAEKSWKEKAENFLLVLCSVVFVVSAGMLVYYLLWEPYQHNQKSVESSRFILPGG